MKEKYIKMLGRASRTINHELIVECLDHYNAEGIHEITEKHLADFCKLKGIKE